MGEVKQINIKNQTYCSYNDKINLKDFDARLLKVDQKKKKKNTARLIFIILVMWLLKNC